MMYALRSRPESRRPVPADHSGAAVLKHVGPSVPWLAPPVATDGIAAVPALASVVAYREVNRRHWFEPSIAHLSARPVEPFRDGAHVRLDVPEQFTYAG
jgi:hypothetical protein